MCPEPAVAGRSAMECMQILRQRKRGRARRSGTVCDVRYAEFGTGTIANENIAYLKPGQGEAGALVINESVEMRGWGLGRGRSWAVDAQGRPKVTISVQVKPRPTWEGFPAPSAKRAFLYYKF